MTKSVLPFLLVFILSAFGTGTACADIYTFTDEYGNVHFSNIPNDPRFIPILKTPGSESQAAPLKSHTHFANQKKYIPLIADAAKANQLEFALVHAVICAESGYNPNAKSPKGAIGLMQLMPATARRYGITNLYDPAQNIQAGALYLRDLMHLFNNDVNLALAAYNAGENAVLRYDNHIPPYRETRQYVPKVLKFYSSYRSH